MPPVALGAAIIGGLFATRSNSKTTTTTNLGVYDALKGTPGAPKALLDGSSQTSSAPLANSEAMSTNAVASSAMRMRKQVANQEQASLFNLNNTASSGTALNTNLFGA